MHRDIWRRHCPATTAAIGFLTEIQTWWERYITAGAQLNKIDRKRTVSNAGYTAGRLINYIYIK